MPNYTALVVMSFCCGLVYFASLSNNTKLLVPTTILAVAAMIYSEGYHLRYFKSLTTNTTPSMPEWKDAGSILLTGIKYATAVLILSLALGAILLIFGFITAAATIVSKIFGIILLMLFFLICFIMEIFLVVCLPSFFCTFTDSEGSVLSFLNIKNLCKYFSVNYFITLFTILILALLNSCLSFAASINIKYNLTYIIPLMLAPIIRLWTDNLIAQSYLANKSGEQGSIAKMCILLLVLLLIVILPVILILIFIPR